MSTEREELHILILPLSAYGHLIPALVFANKLVTLGYQVTYVCHQCKFQQVLKQAKARGCSNAIKFKTLKMNNPAEHEDSPMEDDSAAALQWMVTHSKQDRIEFNQIMQEFFTTPGVKPPCCLVTDYLVSAYAQDIANQFNIPRMIIYPSPAMALAVVFYVKNLVESGRFPLRIDQEVKIPGVDYILHTNEVSTAFEETSSKAVHDFYIENCSRVHDAAGLLCNTFDELENVACKALQENIHLNPNKVPYLSVGPLLPDSYFNASRDSNTDYECIKWLDKQPKASVIYIAFGSLARASDEQVRELALGLEASGKRFLWVLPGDGVKNLPSEFLERTKDRGLIMRTWAPQLLILSHESVGGFLSHCGWNSTIESISQGVPMLTMPFFAEQGGNAKMIVEQLRIGVRLTKDGNGLIKREIIENAVKHVTDEGDEMRKNALKLKQAAQFAAIDSLQKMKVFIDSIVTKFKN